MFCELNRTTSSLDLQTATRRTSLDFFDKETIVLASGKMPYGHKKLRLTFRHIRHLEEAYLLTIKEEAT